MRENEINKYLDLFSTRNPSDVNKAIRETTEWVNDPKRGVDVIFVGNPGSGKSTLLSNLSGYHFECGVAWGAGLTSKLDFMPLDVSNKKENIRYADTPGLADAEKAEQAAKAITEAFENARKDNRAVKLIFTVILHAGRVQPEELYTIRKVLSSIKLKGNRPLPPNSYQILVNKISKKLVEGDSFKNHGRHKVESFFDGRVKGDHPPTNAIFYSFKLPELEDEDNARIEDKTYLEQLKRAVILASPLITEIGEVIKIDTQRMTEDVKALKEIMNKQTEALENRIATMQKEHKEEAERWRVELEREKDNKMNGGGVLTDIFRAFPPTAAANAITKGLFGRGLF